LNALRILTGLLPVLMVLYFHGIIKKKLGYLFFSYLIWVGAGAVSQFFAAIVARWFGVFNNSFLVLGDDAKTLQLINATTHFSVGLLILLCFTWWQRESHKAGANAIAGL